MTLQPLLLRDVRKCPDKMNVSVATQMEAKHRVIRGGERCLSELDLGPGLVQTGRLFGLGEPADGRATRRPERSYEM